MGNCPSKGARPTTHELRGAREKTTTSAGRSVPFPPSQPAAPVRCRPHDLPHNLPRKPRFIEDIDSDSIDPPLVDLDSLARPSPPPDLRNLPTPPPSEPTSVSRHGVAAPQGTTYPRPTRVREPGQQGWLPSGHTPASAGGGRGGGLHRSGAVRGRRPEAMTKKPLPPERRQSSLGRAPTRPTPPPPLSTARVPPASSGQTGQAPNPSSRATVLSRAATAYPSRTRSAKPVNESYLPGSLRDQTKRQEVSRQQFIAENGWDCYEFDIRYASNPNRDRDRENRAKLAREKRERERPERERRLTEFSEMGLPPPPPAPAAVEEVKEEGGEKEEAKKALPPTPPVSLKRRPAVHHRVNTYKPAAERRAVATAASRPNSVKTTRPIARPSK